MDRDTDMWVEAVKTKKQTPGSFTRAQTITDTINLGAIALRAGKRIEFDANIPKITNDESANQYLTREYRKGWEI